MFFSKYALPMPFFILVMYKLFFYFRECTKKSLGEQEKIPCDICNKEFSDKHTLEKHVKAIHYKILDHHCNFCSYKTYTKFNLR